jgi:predicted TIM-barrel fold metal-dependent hydrolase
VTAIDFPIVDPHVHLWDPRTTPRAASPLVRTLGWWPGLMHKVATAVLPAPVRGFLGRADYILAPHLPADHAAGVAPLRIDTVVHVEAGWEAFGALGPAGETRWLETLDYAGAGMRLGAIVAHADLRSERLSELLSAHRAASPRLRGIRHKAARHPSAKVMSWTRVDRLYQDAAFLRGFEQLAALELSFDAWCYSTQLRDVAALAARFPEVTIVLDHLGTPVGAAGPVADVGATPEERARIVGSWRDDLARVAEHSNVVAKLSGLTMPVVGFDFHTRATEPSVSELVERLGPFMRHALGCFGVSRCCFASNFPMDKVSASGARLFEAYAQLAAERGTGAPRALLRDNALRFYRV